MVLDDITIFSRVTWGPILSSACGKMPPRSRAKLIWRFPIQGGYHGVPLCSYHPFVEGFSLNWGTINWWFIHNIKKTSINHGFSQKNIHYWGSIYGTPPLIGWFSCFFPQWIHGGSRETIRIALEHELGQNKTSGWSDWNHGILWLSINNGNGIIIPTEELHHFSEGWLNHQPENIVFSHWDYHFGHGREVWWPKGFPMLIGWP